MKIPAITPKGPRLWLPPTAPISAPLRAGRATDQVLGTVKLVFTHSFAQAIPTAWEGLDLQVSV